MGPRPRRALEQRVDSARGNEVQTGERECQVRVGRGSNLCGSCWAPGARGTGEAPRAASPPKRGSPALAACQNEKYVADFYISDFQSGLRALVKAGHGAKVAPYAKPVIVVDLCKRSTVSVMGVVQRHDNGVTIVPPQKPVSTGCQWFQCLLPTYVEGPILMFDDNEDTNVVPV
ncbi:hypothetical protein GH714_020896 [Hevea brasiliensis]|uniref:Uncharacterized protein n=1 Tax=Hevea brasiliensis TaxID=3981 RepID=A0A6A6LCR8_HEVBR|nr:hypothetical protein GH714_020896 [Hevea brasiliensis]